MSQYDSSRSRQQDGQGNNHQPRGASDGRRHNDTHRAEVYAKRVPAGKRTYFFDVKQTRSGEDFFLTITESKRLDEGRFEKHKIFLYKEDFGKFVSALHAVIRHVQDECLPDYTFEDMPELTALAAPPNGQDFREDRY